MVEVVFSKEPDYYFEGIETEVSDEKLEEVTGITIFREENKPPLPPIPKYPDSNTLNKAVVEILRENYTKFEGSC